MGDVDRPPRGGTTEFRPGSPFPPSPPPAPPLSVPSAGGRLFIAGKVCIFCAMSALGIPQVLLWRHADAAGADNESSTLAELATEASSRPSSFLTPRTSGHWPDRLTGTTSTGDGGEAAFCRGGDFDRPLVHPGETSMLPASAFPAAVVAAVEIFCFFVAEGLSVLPPLPPVPPSLTRAAFEAVFFPAPFADVLASPPWLLEPARGTAVFPRRAVGRHRWSLPSPASTTGEPTAEIAMGPLFAPPRPLRLTPSCTGGGAAAPEPSNVATARSWRAPRRTALFSRFDGSAVLDAGASCCRPVAWGAVC